MPPSQPARPAPTSSGNALRRFAIPAAVALAALVWWLWWRSASVQAPRTFAAIASAVAEGDAPGVLARVHRDYPFRTLWPDVFADDSLGAAYEPRTLAFAGLRQLFEHQKGDPIRLDWTLHEIRPQDDGTVVAIVSLSASSPSGHLWAGPQRALDHHRFVLARDGWSAALLVRDHDPIALAR